MAERFIQLKRNKNVFLDGKTAYSVVDAPDFLTSKKDGEAIIARYKIDSTKPATKENLAVAVGHVIKTSEVECIVFNDINLLEHAVGVDHNVSSITQYVSGTTNYIKGDADIVEALITLDNSLHDVSGNTDNLAKVIGVTTADTSINKYISGNTTYISGDTTVIKALTTLDKKSVSGVTVEQDLIDGQYDDTTSDKYTTTVTLNDGTEYDDDVQLRYTAWSPANLQVPKTIGDIEKGTKASELNGRTISQMLDDIVFPTVYPDLVSPSMTFATAVTYATTVELGATLPSFKISYTKGDAKVDDGVTPRKNYTGKLSGGKINCTYTEQAANTNAGVSKSGTSYTSKDVTSDYTFNISATDTVAAKDNATATTTTTYLEVGKYVYTGTSLYEAGSVLVTSKGASPNPIRYNSLDGNENTTKATVANPHAASSVSAGTVTVNVSLPIYANSGSTYSSTTKKLPIQVWGAMTVSAIQFPTTNTSTPIIIETPRKINTFNSYNELSSKYDVAQRNSISTTPTEVEYEFGGKKIKYYRYVWVGGTVSSRKFEIKTF